MDGSITINKINDKHLAEILKVKMKHENSLGFNPNQMQPNMVQVRATPGHPGGQKQEGYNNAILIWKDADGLAAVREILRVFAEELHAEGQVHQAAA